MDFVALLLILSSSDGSGHNHLLCGSGESEDALTFSKGVEVYLDWRFKPMHAEELRAVGPDFLRIEPSLGSQLLEAENRELV